MNRRLVAATLASTLVLAGCAGGSGGGQTARGAGPGGLTISESGSEAGRAGTTAFGVVLGGLLASDVGKSLDKADQAYMADKTNRALESAPTNQASSWQNPDGGSQASVTPTRTYQDPNGTYCREYSQTVTAGGKQETARGTACRRSDGTWQTIG